MNTKIKEFIIADHRTPYAAFCVILSVIMVLSVQSGASISVLFAQMAAIPLIFSSISLTPLITALPLIFVLIGLSFISYHLTLGYLLLIALPSLLLGYLTVYKQKFTVEIKTADSIKPEKTDVYYINSSGFIISILALFGVSISIYFVILFALPIENLHTKLNPLITKMQDAAAIPTPILEILKDTQLRNSFLQAIPIAVLILWFCSTVASFYIAARLAKYFNLLTRPWPNFVREYDMSTVIIIATGAALIGVFLPYPFGYIAEFATALFMILWIFAGLCSVHYFARKYKLPAFSLSLFYISLIVFGWLLIFVALFGVLDALFGYRSHKTSNFPPLS